MSRISNERNMKTFFLYSIFAWGLPLIITLLAFFVDFYQIFDHKYLPNFGVATCWFQEINSFAHILYFIVPISVLIFANFIFFFLTNMYCKDIQNDIIASKSTDRNGNRKKRFIALKTRFSMNLKVFVLMSVLWVMEIISNMVPSFPKEIFYITDAINVLQGFFIFLIFVCNKRVITAIKCKFGRGSIGRPRTLSLTGSDELITYNE